MATDDEPLDDLRAVGMTAGVTAARVVETIARDAQQRAQQQREAVQATQRQAVAQVAVTATARTGQGQPYDSPARRKSADQAMRAAGVSDEARQARNVADLMNGSDPALAASSGRPTQPAVKPQTKTPTRERTR